MANFVYSAPMSAGAYRRLVEKLRIMSFHATNSDACTADCANCSGTVVTVTWTPPNHTNNSCDERCFDVCLECGKTVEEFFQVEDDDGNLPYLLPTDQPLYAVNPIHDDAYRSSLLNVDAVAG